MVIADIEEGALESAAASLADAAGQQGVAVHGVVTNCADDDSVANLAAAVEELFPDRPISLLAANAGVVSLIRPALGCTPRSLSLGALDSSQPSDLSRSCGRVVGAG